MKVWQWSTHDLWWSSIYLWNTLRKQRWIQQTRTPQNDSDVSMTISWFGHMDWQDCSNFFSASTVLFLPLNSQWKLNLMIDTVSFLDVLVMRRGPKLATKVYWKPTHAGHYFIHSLISRAKVICQDHKDFDKEIRNLRHDLMLNEYPQEFAR
jgi:hypothetical protein